MNNQLLSRAMFALRSCIDQLDYISQQAPELVTNYGDAAYALTELESAAPMSMVTPSLVLGDWIDVNERLPEQRGNVVVQFEGVKGQQHVAVVEYDPNMHWKWWVAQREKCPPARFYDQPTHWQPYVSVQVAPEELNRQVDEALGLVPILVRMDKQLHERLTDAARDNGLIPQAYIRNLIEHATAEMAKYPKMIPCVGHNRHRVTVKQWHNRPHQLVDMVAYRWFPEEADYGLDGWRVVDGLDEMEDGSYEIWYGNGISRKIKGTDFLYVHQNHYADVVGKNLAN